MAWLFTLLAVVLTASCGGPRLPELERRDLRLVINADTVQYVLGDTLTLSITAQNVNSEPITIFPMGPAMTLWPEPDGFMLEDLSGLCGCDPWRIEDTVHLEPSEAVTFDTRFAQCTDSLPMFNGRYVVKYQMDMQLAPVHYRIHVYSENAVMVYTHPRR